MSRVLLAVAIDDCGLGPLAAKEAAVMRLEPLGGVQVLRIKVEEPEQMRMAGGTFDTQKPKPAPAIRSGQAKARSLPQPPAPMKYCFSCGCFRSGPGQDYSGNSGWGTCGRTGKPVYDLMKSRCAGWTKLGG